MDSNCIPDSHCAKSEFNDTIATLYAVSNINRFSEGETGRPQHQP